MIVARELLAGVRGHLVHRFAEWVICAQLMMFGTGLLGEGRTFASSPAYDFMASFANENIWGWAIFFVAAARFVALTVNGSVRWFRPYSPVIRSIAAYFSSATFALLALSMYHGNPIGTGWRIYLVLAVADLALALIIAQEAGKALSRLTNGKP